MRILLLQKIVEQDAINTLTDPPHVTMPDMYSSYIRASVWETREMDLPSVADLQASEQWR